VSIEVEAVYEGGVLKPVRDLPLEEHQLVKIIVQESSGSPASTEKQTWWQTLQEIIAEQKKRGFVGTVSEIRRGDESYEKRLREIRRNTISGLDE
jgi:predicted DNA-binding antitoxin AbrB/MazE fold protein